jgi:hypothetical protein
MFKSTAAAKERERQATPSDVQPIVDDEESSDSECKHKTDIM